MTIYYFDILHAQIVHDNLVAQTGGLAGNKDIGQLDSVLFHIQNDDYYPTFELKLTHLFYCTVQGHAFNDGNKRSSLALGGYFLELNGYDYCIKKFFTEMENIAVSVAEGKIRKPLLEKIITSIIYETEFSESLQLEIIDVLSQRIRS